jgi:hypothetical protein
MHDIILYIKNATFQNVIIVGHTKATIYRYDNRDSTSYTVVWYEGEVRKRKVFGEDGAGGFQEWAGWVELRALVLLWHGGRRRAGGAWRGFKVVRGTVVCGWLRVNWGGRTVISNQQAGSQIGGACAQWPVRPEDYKLRSGRVEGDFNHREPTEHIGKRTVPL